MVIFIILWNAFFSMNWNVENFHNRNIPHKVCQPPLAVLKLRRTTEQTVTTMDARSQFYYTQTRLQFRYT